MRLPLVAVVLFVSASAHAQDSPRRYSVLSLIGDRFLVATPASSLDSRGNPPAFIELPDRAVDAHALAAVKETLTRLEPGAQIGLLVPKDTALYAAQRRVLEAGGDAKALAGAIRELLPELPATHLIVLAKLRHEPRIGFANVYFETSGRLEGLGFYVDRAKRVVRRDTKEVAYGYLGLFAYFRIIVIDAATWSVVADEWATGSFVHREPDREPWEGISAADKVKLIEALTRDEIARALPRALRKH